MKLIIITKHGYHTQFNLQRAVPKRRQLLPDTMQYHPIFTVVPSGITNFETRVSIFRSSSAVFSVTGIVAIELAVENAKVWGLRNFENVEDTGLFATNFKINV